MHDFDYDVLEKKRIARNARYKKNGSKSKKCTLPSDYLTRKEKEALNGDVVSIKLNEKYDYKTFKSFPYEMKKDYLDNLREKYGVSLKDIQSGLFPNITYKAFILYCGRNKLSVDFPRGKTKPSPKQEMDWSVFVHDIPVEQENVNVGIEESTGDNSPCSKTDPETSGMSVLSITGEFGGRCTPYDVCNQLFEFLSKSKNQVISNFSFTVNFEKE